MESGFSNSASDGMNKAKSRIRTGICSHRNVDKARVQGMRTLVVTNYTESPRKRYPAAKGETWGYYPDAQPVRSFYPGDQRAALAPFLAFRELGDTFKWLLYGDDDTVFFVDAALRLASTMDPDMPYIITDNMWWSPHFGGASHPHKQVCP